MNWDLYTLYTSPDYFQVLTGLSPNSVDPSFDLGERPPVLTLLRSGQGEAGCMWWHWLCCVKW